MGKTRKTSKDVVRERSEGCCERCSQILTVTTHGNDQVLTDRTIHHRQPQRSGGRDSVINMVNLCVRCHREIHADEKKAALDGWIIINRFPGNVPFRSWRGWVQPNHDGSLTLLDFEAGRAVPMLTPPLRATRDTSPRRSRQGHRPRRETRKSSRYLARSA